MLSVIRSIPYSALSEFSVISCMSTVEGYPLSGVPLYSIHCMLRMMAHKFVVHCTIMFAGGEGTPEDTVQNATIHYYTPSKGGMFICFKLQAHKALHI